MLEFDLVLKASELFLAGEISTDGSGEQATGLYLRDTRHLDRFAIRLNGTRPITLATRFHGGSGATVTGSNGGLELDDGTHLPAQRLLVETHVELNEVARVTISIQSFARASVPLVLGVELGADFRDLFDIRGFVPTGRGTLRSPERGDDGIRLVYEGIDGRVAETRIELEGGPSIAIAGIGSPPSARELVRATWSFVLAPGEHWTTTVGVTPTSAAEQPIGTAASDGLGTAIVTGDPELDIALRQSIADLEMLSTGFPEGQLLAAGVPWFIAPFGRDCVIAGMQSLHIEPAWAIGALQTLAVLQGEEVDPFREEEPGKILHEMRYGEMARTHQVPHSPYYGSVDATPLWLWLFAETVRWTANPALYQELLPHAHRALAWIDSYGDIDGDGLIEYRTDHLGTARIAHQVWKDSHDSLHDDLGVPVTGNITPVEVQGYHYAAASGLALVSRAFGDAAFAVQMEERAARVREEVEARFWLPQRGCYAQALDEAKRPVGSGSSNGGHLLLTGLPSSDRARATAKRLAGSDADSGWGIRTLFANEPAYNPMSYHNGSVWPHDNSLIGAGLFSYELTTDGGRLVLELRDAAVSQPRARLPELMCGFARDAADPSTPPVAYPVSCSPQAWAAGALPFLVRAMMGLSVDLARRTLVVRPALPPWLDQIEIRALAVLGRRGHLVVERDGDRYRVTSGDLPLAV